MATLGQELREERERRSISLRDISDRTKIGTRILIALENDHWELMPQKFFIKGVIKAYAQAIGADPAVFLAKYDDQREERPEFMEKYRNTTARKAGRIPDEDLIKSGEQPARSFRKFLIAGAAVLLAAAAVYFILIKPGSSRPQTTPQESSSPAPTAAIPPAETKPAEEKPTVVETGLRLEFQFTADSWMYVTADGVVVMNGISAGGSKAEIRAEKEFVLQTGNAGGFDFTLNGRPGRPLGGPGRVLTDIRINLDNFGTFLKEEKSSAQDADGR